MLLNNNEKPNSKIPFQKVREVVYKIIKRRISSAEDAEDITQNVMLRGWRSNEKNSDHQKFESEEDFLKYFSTIAFNEINRFKAKELKTLEQSVDEELLLMIPDDHLNPENCLEILDTICELPLKQRLALILGERMLLISFQKVFSTKIIAGMMEINESLLEKLANDIPLSGEDIKYVIETMMGSSLKTTIHDEKWKARKSLKRFFRR